MKLTKKTILWVIWATSVLGLGSSLYFMANNLETKHFYFNIILFIFLAVTFPLTEYSKKRKIEEGKKELRLTGDMSLDQIESLRIEKDYQERYAIKSGPKN